MRATEQVSIHSVKAHLKEQSDFNLRQTAEHQTPQFGKSLDSFSITPRSVTDGAILLLPLICLAIWAIVTSILTDLFEPGKEAAIAPKSGDALSPCYNCRFFSENFYLKCAVHPCTVLTAEASECSDYEPM
jgi:hypothetical protein